MKWLNNLFKKSNMKESSTPEVKPVTIIKYSGVSYTTDNFDTIKVQSVDSNIRPYGWVVEIKWHKYDDSWATHWNNKVYSSHYYASEALINIKKTLSRDYDFRITALYSMDQNFYRDYKINKILDNNYSKKEYEIKSWKLKEDVDIKHKYGNVKLKAGTVFIQLENGSVIRSGTPKDPTRVRYYRDILFEQLIPNKLVNEVKLKDEKWLYPHLLRELKLKLKK